MDANFWKRFQYAVNLLHYYVWWLFYFGIIVIIGAAFFITLCVFQYMMV